MASKAKKTTKTKTPKKADPNRPLNAMQQRFCLEYLLDLNAAQAAIRSGYSAASAKVIGYRLISDPRIQAVVEKHKAERAERTRISIDGVVMELAKVSFASMRHFISVDADGQPVIDLSHTNDDNLDALSEISTETVIESTGSGEERTANKVRKSKIKLHDKIRSLQLLGDHVGAFKADREQTANAFVQAYQQLLNSGSKAPIKKGNGK
jgi:phage terminase small subunit